jgi:hypothetical protein
MPAEIDRDAPEADDEEEDFLLEDINLDSQFQLGLKQNDLFPSQICIKEAVPPSLSMIH